MNSKQAINVILAMKDLKNRHLAKRMGMDSKSLWMRLNREDCKWNVKTLNDAARALDYKIVLVPVDTRVKEGWYEINEV